MEGFWDTRSFEMTSVGLLRLAGFWLIGDDDGCEGIGVLCEMERIFSNGDNADIKEMTA